jgi:hypothetical protein
VSLYVVENTRARRRRAGPFATEAEAFDALAAIHRADGSGCCDLDLEDTDEEVAPSDT